MGRSIRIVNRLSVLKPRSTCRNRWKLRTNKPAPTSNTTASATSETTSKRRTGRPETPPPASRAVGEREHHHPRIEADRLKFRKTLGQEFRQRFDAPDRTERAEQAAA